MSADQRQLQPRAINCNLKALIKPHLLTALLILLTQVKSTTGEQGPVQQPPNKEAETSKDATIPENSQQQASLTKILIPDLPWKQYKFWLRNHPLAYESFKQICHTFREQPSLLGDAQQFAAIHSNLTFENGRFWSDFDYSRRFTTAACLDIDDVPKHCWGYEINCQTIYLMPDCSNTKPDKEFDQRLAWFNKADMGYILTKRREMSAFCALDKYSNDTVKSSLHCSSNFATCYGYNLAIKFPPKLPANNVIQETELFNEGDVGGWNCDLQVKRIQEEAGQREPLQSWYNEFRKYQRLKPSDKCDVYIDKPTFFVQLDIPSNMYHYLGTFLNLYATMHLNSYLNSDNQIIVWDSAKPRSYFERVWSAFSANPVKSLADFAGRRVCFRRFYSALPPRMVDGLYYGTQLPDGCSKSGLFDAFNKHVLHRLNIQQSFGRTDREKDTVRIAILDRSSAKNRRLLDAPELLSAVRGRFPDFRAELFDFERIQFTQQLEIVHNTDILVGIHGAGLTHTLFLPDWAALLELYDCNDPCYRDLARLRGVKYFSAGKHREVVQKVPAEEVAEPVAEAKSDTNPKLMNFRLADVEAILQLIDKAARRVQQDRAQHFERDREQLARIERQLELAPIMGAQRPALANVSIVPAPAEAPPPPPHQPPPTPAPSPAPTPASSASAAAPPTVSPQQSEPISATAPSPPNQSATPPVPPSTRLADSTTTTVPSTTRKTSTPQDAASPTTEPTSTSPAPTMSPPSGPAKLETPALEPQSEPSSSTEAVPVNTLDDARQADEAQRLSAGLGLHRTDNDLTPNDQLEPKLKRKLKGLFSNRASDQKATNEAPKSAENGPPPSPPTPRTLLRVRKAGSPQGAPPPPPPTELNAAKPPETTKLTPPPSKAGGQYVPRNEL